MVFDFSNDLPSASACAHENGSETWHDVKVGKSKHKIAKVCIKLGFTIKLNCLTKRITNQHDRRNYQHIGQIVRLSCVLSNLLEMLSSMLYFL